MKKRKPTYLSFGLGKENYAVSTLKVLEVLEAQRITPVPNTPVYIKGIINFRGNMIPVISMRYKLNLPENNKIEDNVIIIFDVVLNKQQLFVAAIADNVKDVIAANDNEIRPVPKTGINFNIQFINGILEYNQNFVMILNVDKVFALNDLNNV